jgi:hypothetical protein
VAFIEISGNVDIAAKNGILYADNWIDLLLFDISNPDVPKLKNRIEGVFAGVLPSTDNDYPVSKIDTAGKVVVGWTQELITEDITLGGGCRGCYYDYAYLNSDASKSPSWGSESYRAGSGTTGVNGSMSRFAISGNYLYTLNIQNVWGSQPSHSSYWSYPTGWLKIFDIENEQCIMVNHLGVSSAVETMFAYGDHLFLGLSNGMQIYSIENPSAPAYVSSSWHFWGCDPVVVSGNFAYLTVRSSNVCGQNGNMLQVIDISNVTQPAIISQYAMQEPFGLGVDDNKLFICDNGLKVFDATNPREVGSKLLFATTEFKGFDLIPYNNLLLVIGGDGLYQYNYTSDNRLNRLSVISVSK